MMQSNVCVAGEIRSWLEAAFLIDLQSARLVARICRMNLHHHRLIVQLACFALISAAPAMAADAEWPQWGGPGRDFKIAAAKQAAAWPADGPKRLWRREFPDGYSAIIAGGNRLYTMCRRGPQEVVVALDAQTGSTIWEHSYEAPPLEGQVLDFGQGPNATPLLAGDRLITLGFTSRMHCLEAGTGKVLWSHDLVKEFGGKVQEFGYSASPLLRGDRVITLVGGAKTGVMAFELGSGAAAWSSEPLDISYASPIVIRVDDQEQIVFMSSTEVIGLDAGGSRVEWRWPCKNQFENNCSTPIWGRDNRLWITTQQDGGTRMLRLARRDGRTQVEQVWKSDDIRLFHWNAIWEGDTIYASIGDTTTLLAGIDAKTGAVLWRERGFSKAKMVYAGGKFILLDEDGRLGLVTASPEKATIHANVQLLEKVAWTPPTLVGRTLYVRDKTQIMALDLGE
jgi:outer membrane protein assembly factor BamB